MKKPILIAKDVCQLTPEVLSKRGIRIVLCDLDNTLAGYSANVPDKAVGEWIQSLKDAGIPLFIVSNAGQKRVAAFCEPLGLPFMSKARKPRPHALLEAASFLGASPAEAAMVGDQFFTDGRAGRNAGIQVVLVPPRVKGFFFTLRRWAETPFIKRSLEQV
ncbi:MAG: YqeG family HAD IIIA-type phosphatase [Oscillospiraceae bacterium]|jgi:HAD superfamily phosphatase (TIGR01668 family)|nr:YqeG family HAD IIIA-type phosphatase [Oscillospiraceae bacterium]